MTLTDVMMDIETLSTEPSAVIVSVALIRFDPLQDYLAQGRKVGDFPSLHLLVDTQTQENRDIKTETLDWWSRQSPLVQESIFGESHPRVSLSDALDQIHNFIWQKSQRIWTQGPQFDITILENAYREYNKSFPWDFWRVRDCRTIQDLAPVIKQTVTHDALADCWGQILCLQQGLKRLGVTEFYR